MRRKYFTIRILTNMYLISTRYDLQVSINYIYKQLLCNIILNQNNA